MTTKTDLLERANEEFPEHWEFLRTANPRMQLPVRESFPIVLKMTVGEITHDQGTEALLTLEIREGESDPVELRGVSFETHHDTTCEFVGTSPELKQFAEEFTINLIFNMLCEEGLSIEKWQALPD